MHKLKWVKKRRRMFLVIQTPYLDRPSIIEAQASQDSDSVAKLYNGVCIGTYLGRRDAELAHGLQHAISEIGMRCDWCMISGSQLSSPDGSLMLCARCMLKTEAPDPYRGQKLRLQTPIGVRN